MKKEIVEALKKLLGGVDDDDPVLKQFVDKVNSTGRTIKESGMIRRKSKAKRIKLKVKLAPEARLKGLDSVAARTLAQLRQPKVRIVVPRQKPKPLKPVDEMDPRDEAELSVYEQRKRAGKRALRRAGYENGAEAAKRTIDNFPPLRGRR